MFTVSGKISVYASAAPVLTVNHLLQQVGHFGAAPCVMKNFRSVCRFVLKVAKEHTPTCKPERHDKESILRIFPGAKPIRIVSGNNRSNLGRPFQFTPYR